MNLHIANISNLASKEDVANHLVQFKPYISDLKLYNNPDVKKRTRVAIIKFKDKRRAESAVDCLTGSILKDQQIFLELEEEKPEEVPKEIRTSSESSEDSYTADGRSLRNGMYKCHGCNKQFRSLPYFSGHLELCKFNQEKLRVQQEQILRKRGESAQERILKNLENNSNHPDLNQNSVEEKKQPEGGGDVDKHVKADLKKKKKLQKSAADAPAENAQFPLESENSGSSAEFLSDSSSDPAPCPVSASQRSVTNLTTSLSGSTPSILQPQGSTSTPAAPGYGPPAGFPNLLILNQILQTNPALLNNPTLMNQILGLDLAQVLGNQQNQLLGNQQNQLLGNHQNLYPGGFQNQFPSNLQNPFLGNGAFQFPGNLSNQFSGNLPNQFPGNLLNQFPGNFQNQYFGNPYSQFSTDVQTQASGNMQANFPSKTHPQFPGYLPNQFPGNSHSHQFATLQSQLGNLQNEQAGNQVAGNLHGNQFNRNLPDQSMNGQFSALNPVMSILNPRNNSAPDFLQEVNSQPVRKPSLKQHKSGMATPNLNINKMEDCCDVEGRRHVKFKEPVFESGEQQFSKKPSLSENSSYRPLWSTEAEVERVQRVTKSSRTLNDEAKSATNRTDSSSAKEVPSRARFISDGAEALYDGARALPNEAIALPEEPAVRPAVVQDNELILQQERILQDIQRKNWEKKKEEEATANLIKQLQIQDEKDRLDNLTSKPAQKPVKPVQIITKSVGGWERPQICDADGFQVVQRKRSNQSQAWSREFPSLEAQEQFDPTQTNARIRRLNKQERAMKEELDQIDEEKRQLQKDLNLWESKKRENETIEKMIKHQEEGRKIRLVSQDQVQAPELDLIQPQVPENLSELMSVTHHKKVRAEIKRSVREITSLQEKLYSLKVRRENIKDYENERSAMGSELKERRMMSEMLEKQNYVKEGGVVVHQELINLQNGQQGLKRQKNLSENSDEVLALGKKAVLENTRYNSKPWQQASINKKKK